MTGTIAPFPKHQFFTSAGAIAAGYQLFTYNSGTAVKANTWTDAAMTSLNTDPIILDSAGRASIFLLPGTSLKFVLALPTDADPPVSPIWSIDSVSAVNSSDSIVLSGGLVVGFAGTVTNDQIKLGDANFFLDWNSGTVPRWVLDGGPDDIRFTRATNTLEFVIANTAEATITVDGMQIANGLNVGFAAAPQDDRVLVGDASFGLTFDATTPMLGFESTNSSRLYYNRTSDFYSFEIAGTDRFSINSTGFAGVFGANVLSAAAIVPTGNVFHVTANNAITSITATNVRNGTVITMIFDGTPTVTDGSNLNLAGNFVASAGDTMTLVWDNGASLWHEMCRSVN